MRKNKGDFLLENSETKRLFNALPIIPEKAISKKDLAKKLKINGTQCCFIINRLPANAPVYEDFGAIGRIK